MDSMFREFLILSGVATCLVFLSLKLRLPSLVGFIVTGILLGPSGLALVTAIPDSSKLTELVGVMLMFTIGLEFSRQKLLEMRHQVFKLGLTQVVVTCVLTLGLVVLLGFGDWRKGLIWGCLVSLSSTALVLKILHDNRDVRSPHGNNSLGVLLFQDVAVIPMLLLFPLLKTSGDLTVLFEWKTMALWLGKTAALVLGVWVLGRYVLPQVLSRIAGRNSYELFFFCILFIWLSFSEIFHVNGMSASLGAFVAGLLIAESDFGNHTATVFIPLRDALLGLFFASVGTMLDLNFVMENAPQVLAIGASGFALKFLALLAVCFVFGVSRDVSLITALTLSQIGEFSFLLAGSAVDLGLFDRAENQYFMSASVLSMVATPFMYKLAVKVVTRAPSDLSVRKNNLETLRPMGCDAIVVGYGVAGEAVIQALSDLHIPVRLVELNYQNVKKAQLKDVTVILGDAVQEEILLKAGVMTAKVVFVTVSMTVSVPRMLEVIRHLRPDIEIVVRFQYVKDSLGLKHNENTQFVVAEMLAAEKMRDEVFRVYGV
jgi:monovalent cation:H+ antiporter-2, CPA2 family